MLLFIFAYILLQFGIGIWVSRSIRTEKDFLVAGRNVPPFFLVFSLFATWFGAETIMGTAGEVFEVGLSGSRADPLGYSLCLVLLGLFIANRIWKSEYLTLADFFKARFGKNVEHLAVLILFISSMIWAGAQIRAFGQIIGSFSSLSVPVTMTLGFGLVVSYSLLGGLMGDILTDVLQGTILILGLVVITAMILFYHDFSLLNAQPPERLSLLGTDETLWAKVERWIIPVLGSLVAQESITRLLAAKNPKQARAVSLWSAGVYLVVGSLPVLLGLWGPLLVSDVPDKEQFILLLSQKYLPGYLQIIFIGALMSAILSTVDSILLSGGGLVSHNLLIPALKIQDEKRKLYLTRASVIFMASLAFFIALVSDGIYALVELASSWGSAGLLVVTVLGLWTKWGNYQTALTTLVAGVLLLPFFEYGLQVETPFLLTLTCCFSLYILHSSYLRVAR